MKSNLFRIVALLLALSLNGFAAAQDLLQPEVAFRFSAHALDANTLEVRYKIADGYYLYRSRFKFSAEPATVKLGTAQFPHGDVHNDEFFGKVETYRKDLRIRLPFTRDPATHRLKLAVTSQGCADAGVCYPPQTQTTEIDLPAAGNASAVSSGGGAGAPGSSAVTGDEARFQGLLASGSFWLIAAAFFGAGVLLTFTPCVLPMIPILSGIIVGEGRKATRTRAFTLSSAYVLGMSLTYTGIGIAAALSGNLLSAALQNAWVLSAFAAVFVLLSLSMFGFYELQLPSGFHAKITETSSRLKGGHLGAVVLMGILSAAIVSPCVAAPLAGALLYISQSHDVILGGFALFAMSIGMGVPLILVGVFEGAFLPKSGHWMRSVKHFFGVLLLAVAIWIVSPVLPLAVQMLAWAALLIGSAMVLRAIDPLPPEAGAATRLWKGAGFLALIAGTALAIGAFAGSRDVLRPLSGLTAGSQSGAQAARFTRVKNLGELGARLQAPGRPVMLDFYADWCVSCKEMEAFTFTDARVKAKMGQMLLLQADVTANTSEDKALLKRFSLFGPPGIIFFDRQGREIEGLRVVGYQSADAFLPTLDRAVAQ
ncbi:MAG TPA: protein-disulfide reductase DsbD [Burkholderiales bacterium]|nr:protein-disulfide reductase DsbD [Burkholderiales bacterium]